MSESQEEVWTPETDKIKQMAAVIRDIYVELRRLYTQRPGYRPGPRFGKDFEKAAKIVLDRDLNPEEFVRAQFEALKLSPNLYPNILHGQKAIERYEAQYNSWEVKEEARHAVQVQLAKLENIRKSNPDIKSILLLSDTDLFDPLFRCVIANIMGLSGIWERYSAEAVGFLRLNPVFRKVYQEILSENHKKKVQSEGRVWIMDLLEGK